MQLNAYEKISGEKQRMDTTVYETNIHYPTDSSLLWDSFRTLSRLLREIQKELPELNLRHRFHDQKVGARPRNMPAKRRKNFWQADGSGPVRRAASLS